MENGASATRRFRHRHEPSYLHPYAHTRTPPGRENGCGALDRGTDHPRSPWGRARGTARHRLARTGSVQSNRRAIQLDLPLLDIRCQTGKVGRTARAIIGESYGRCVGRTRQDQLAPDELARARMRSSSAHNSIHFTPSRNAVFDQRPRRRDSPRVVPHPLEPDASVWMVRTETRTRVESFPLRSESLKRHAKLPDGEWWKPLTEFDPNARHDRHMSLGTSSETST